MDSRLRLFGENNTNLLKEFVAIDFESDKFFSDTDIRTVEQFEKYQQLINNAQTKKKTRNELKTRPATSNLYSIQEEETEDEPGRRPQRKAAQKFRLLSRAETTLKQQKNSVKRKHDNNLDGENLIQNRVNLSELFLNNNINETVKAGSSKEKKSSKRRNKLPKERTGVLSSDEINEEEPQTKKIKKSSLKQLITVLPFDAEHENQENGQISVTTTINFNGRLTRSQARQMGESRRNSVRSLADTSAAQKTLTNITNTKIHEIKVVQPRSSTSSEESLPAETETVATQAENLVLRLSLTPLTGFQISKFLKKKETENNNLRNSRVFDDSGEKTLKNQTKSEENQNDKFSVSPSSEDNESSSEGESEPDKGRTFNKNSTSLSSTNEEKDSSPEKRNSRSKLVKINQQESTVHLQPEIVVPQEVDVVSQEKRVTRSKMVRRKEPFDSVLPSSEGESEPEKGTFNKKSRTLRNSSSSINEEKDSAPEKRNTRSKLKNQQESTVHLRSPSPSSGKKKILQRKTSTIPQKTDWNMICVSSSSEDHDSSSEGESEPAKGRTFNKNSTSLRPEFVVPQEVDVVVSQEKRVTRSKTVRRKEPFNSSPQTSSCSTSPEKRVTRSKMAKKKDNSKNSGEGSSKGTETIEMNSVETHSNRPTKVRQMVQAINEKHENYILESPALMPIHKLSKKIDKENYKSNIYRSPMYTGKLPTGKKTSTLKGFTPLQARNGWLVTPNQSKLPLPTASSASKSKTALEHAERMKKQQELNRKIQRAEEAAKIKEIKLKAKTEEMKKKYEDRVLKVTAVRIASEKEKLENKQRLDRERELREKAMREQAEKKKLNEMTKKKRANEQKAQEAEARRLREEAIRADRMREMEEEQRQQEEQRQRQQEEFERVLKQRQEEQKQKSNSTVKPSPSCRTARIKEALQAKERAMQKKTKPTVAPHKDKDDYGISDIEAGDESSDDYDDVPKKYIPVWARRGEGNVKGDKIRAGVHNELNQKLFPLPTRTPDLTVFFGQMTMKRIRTSSAVWLDSPPLLL